jgi:hypothetical protein
MKAVEQNAPTPSSSNLFTQKIGAFTIPWRRIALYLTLSLGFFLLGFVPMWLRANKAVEQRDVAQREVRLRQLQNSLAAAMVDVQRGEYEPARQTTSEFYTKLRQQIDAGSASVFTASQREKLRPLLAERDHVITLLARSDPAAVDRLFSIYSTYKKLNNGISPELANIAEVR